MSSIKKTLAYWATDYLWLGQQIFAGNEKNSASQDLLLCLLITDV